jgi:catechol 2,3-dioxygenase-like lactoylglutathione lyase family enzyme
MFSKITHITMFVNDQNEALHFYTNILGFKVHTDAVMENGFRWLTLCLKNQPDVELALIPATTPEEKALVGNQGANHPFLCLQTDDCKKEYDLLKANGVVFIQEPRQEPWGVSVLCKDLYGNQLYICQPAH